MASSHELVAKDYLAKIELICTAGFQIQGQLKISAYGIELGGELLILSSTGE